MYFSPEVKNLINRFKIKSPTSNFKRWEPDLFNLLIKETSFLPNNTKKTPILRRLWHIKHNTIDIPKCEICGKNVAWKIKEKTYSKFCSFICASKSKETLIKRQNTNEKRYGVKNYTETKDFQLKKEKTFLEHYGKKHPMQTEKIKQKVRQTKKKRYGNENYYNLEKMKKTNTEKYGVQYNSQIHISSEVLNKINNKEWLINQHQIKKKPLRQICLKELNNFDPSTLAIHMRKFNIEILNFSNSFPERELVEILKKYNLSIKINVRNIIPPYELDIFIPSHNLAIEYCGLYWHSDIRNRINKNYHKKKMEMCNKKGIRLLTIFEDEWLYKKEIVKEKLKSILILNNEKKVFARKTTIINITLDNKKRFFNKYHIQGNGPGSITYGLIYENQLVACMTFIKRKNNKYELNRYATSCTVVGGFSKLLKHFQKNNIWNEIISFADLRWSEGNLYEKTGWKLDKILPPDYSYIINYKRYHKFGFRHILLKNKLKNYDPNLSEKENCYNNGILRIWNCGLKKYILMNSIN